MHEQTGSVERLGHVDRHDLLGGDHLLVALRLFPLPFSNEGERGRRAAPEPRSLKLSEVSFCYFVDGASGFCGLFGSAAGELS